MYTMAVTPELSALLKQNEELQKMRDNYDTQMAAQSYLLDQIQTLTTYARVLRYLYWACAIGVAVIIATGGWYWTRKVLAIAGLVVVPFATDALFTYVPGIGMAITTVGNTGR